MKVSVCMITYGHELYIKQALNGVFMQKANFEIEVIIANDCSPDKSHDIIAETIECIGEGFDVKYFKHTSNKGMIPNFLFALNECTGDYIALCEGDDYWTDPLKLQKQVDFLERNPEYAVCFHEVMTLNPDGLLQPYNGFTEDKIFSIEDLTQGNFIATASSVFRNYDHLQPMPEWFSSLSAGDWGLNMLNATKGKIFFLQDCMAVYRLHNSGVWSSLGSAEMLEKGLQIMDNLNKAFDFKYDPLFQLGKERRIRKFSVPVETPRRGWLLSVKRKIKRVFT